MNKLIAPLVLNLEITSRCNLGCNHCFVSTAPYTNDVQELSTQELIAIFKEFRDLGTLP